MRQLLQESPLRLYQLRGSGGKTNFLSSRLTPSKLRSVSLPSLLSASPSLPLSLPPSLSLSLAARRRDLFRC